MKIVKHSIVSFGILLLIWQLIVYFSGIPEALFPSPLRVAEAFGRLWTEGVLLGDTLASLLRFGLGYISAAVVAILLGLFLGACPRVFAYVNPVIQFLRPISPIAWMPFIVLWFGIGSVPATVIIFIAAFFPVLLSTVSAVAQVDPVYLKVGANFGMSSGAILGKIVLPAAFPQIGSGLHLALGSAWVFLVAGEMVGAQSGLGYRIVDARNNLQSDTLVAVIIVIGLLGLILDQLIRLGEGRINEKWGIRNSEGGTQ